MLLKTIKATNRKFLYFFGAILFVIIFFATVGRNGIIDVYKFKREKNKLSAELSSLKEDNAKLEEEIRLIKTDSRYVTMVAKKELGMVGSQDIIYIIDK